MARILFAAISICLLTYATAAQTTRPASTRPATPASAAGPMASGIEVSIVSTKFEYLALRKHNFDGTVDDLASNEILFVIRLKIMNKGQKDVAYQSFNGTPNKNGASLLDSNKKYLAQAAFGELEAVGITKSATIKPAESVDDLLAFAPPAAGVKSAVLFLPARNHGDSGVWKMEVKIDDDTREPAKAK